MSAAARSTRAAAEARAVTLLAATLHAETEGRPVRGVEALAAAVANRARRALAEGADRTRFAPAAPPQGRISFAAAIAAACRAPFLFACWRDATARAALVTAAANPDARFEACRRIAARALAEALPDPTGGATHWHAAEALPRWASGLVPVGEIGGFVFYRFA